MNATLKAIRKKLGHETLEWSPALWLDTGIPELNQVLGHPKAGLPYGRIFEISGLESHGKSAITMALTAAAQRDGALIIWLDFESSFASDWAIQRGLASCPKCKGSGRLGTPKKPKAGCKECGGGEKCGACRGHGCTSCENSGEQRGLGMDGGKLILIQPYVGAFGGEKEARLASAEELCAEAELVVGSSRKTFDRMMIVVDSLPSMLPGNEAEVGIEGRGLPQQQSLPKLLNALLRRWVGLAQAHNAMIFLINQLRQNPMQRYGSPWYTPGGNAPRFYSHSRVRVKREPKLMRDAGAVVGIEGVMTSKKNKIGGLEGSTVGYKILFKGPVKFIKVKKAKEEE